MKTNSREIDVPNASSHYPGSEPQHYYYDYPYNQDDYNQDDLFTKETIRSEYISVKRKSPTRIIPPQNLKIEQTNQDINQIRSVLSNVRDPNLNGFLI